MGIIFFIAGRDDVCCAERYLVHGVAFLSCPKGVCLSSVTVGKKVVFYLYFATWLVRAVLRVPLKARVAACPLT